ncbi:selection and upkeep of intraepithelial T-cells protein 6 [Xenopus tropicalis]|uniref:Selection and upkeep of intraepithelial T-cells protein 6 n=1 Tax=Xenopus tropicalis TaxID=8364 RepID=A0A803K1C2_XENTR|nr:selection and upkeep of intraepithelial T-cells protein 6 [Xenopus tropicalis]XP_017945101.1 selection and upkeep of intraepithelial T-cells protein 6 [Xenopus tropicalis]XP_031747072.1 selection and upkeep of intraepithelial T-cells protein 6 [Xenopus tropicalis]XP_031747073.1 selection and upkeep of intraepithelial T-cells protein 6 [Xenopus tropicalis]|eukprot:XP_017945099.1 PREDICTED: selection and upkeep of intraepithelial T-cells protein 6-like isoform X2 [Xenopus tropicalis]
MASIMYKITTVFLILWSMNKVSLSVRFQVSSTPSVSAALGSDVELPCRMIPEMNGENMEIRWIKSTYRPYVHLCYYGKDDYTIQMPQFAKRTELLKENITRGIFLLRIHKVTAQDSGNYYCFVESTEHHGKTIVELNVTGSPSKHQDLAPKCLEAPQSCLSKEKSLPETSRDKHRIIIIICASLTIVSFVCICLLLKRLGYCQPQPSDKLTARAYTFCHSKHESVNGNVVGFNIKCEGPVTEDRTTPLVMNGKVNHT